MCTDRNLKGLSFANGLRPAESGPGEELQARFPPKGAHEISRLPGPNPIQLKSPRPHPLPNPSPHAFMAKASWGPDTCQETATDEETCRLGLNSAAGFLKNEARGEGVPNLEMTAAQ